MPDPTALQFALVLLAGGGVGVVAGTFGVGGGFLLVPVLNILLGVPMEFAVGAGTCQALGPATTALLYRGVDKETLRFPLVILGGLFVGVLGGASTLEWATSLSGDEETAPFVDHMVLWVYLVMLLGLGLFAIVESWMSSTGRPLPRGWLRRIPLPPMGRFPDLGVPSLSIPILAWFGLGVGYLSGLLGISGGLVLLPGVVYLFGVTAQDAVRCSLVVVWLVSAQATAVHAWNGFVDLPLVAALMVGGTLGARLGSVLGSRLGSAGLRQRFGWLLLAAAALVAYKVWRLSQ